MQGSSLGELPVAGAIDDLLVLPERERVRPRGRQQQPPPLGDLRHRPAKLPQLLGGLGHALARLGGDLEHRLHQLGLHLPLELRRHGGEDRLDLLGQAQAVGVEDHQLLLDADRERGAVEAVFEHEWARLLWAPWGSGRVEGRPGRTSGFWLT